MICHYLYEGKGYFLSQNSEGLKIPIRGRMPWYGIKIVLYEPDRKRKRVYYSVNL